VTTSYPRRVGVWFGRGSRHVIVDLRSVGNHCRCGHASRSPSGDRGGGWIGTCV